MEKYFGLLIGILILLTVVLTAILGLVVYFVFFKKGSSQSSSKQEDHDKKIFKSIGPTANTPTLSTCEFHEDVKAVNVCAICGSQICEHCVREDENIVFCPDHFKTYVDHKWVEITNIRTTADTPEASAHVHEFKKKIWKKESTPTFIVTHYKIDLENDQIESYVKLMVREEEESELLKRLKESIQ